MTILDKLSLNAKAGLLVAVTALVVAYVRTFFQYGGYGWESISDFLLSWFVHYLGVWLFVAISGAFVSRFAPVFLGKDLPREVLSPSELIVYISLVVLVGAIILFLLAHWPASGIYDE
ncbi:MAG: hypothetical protein HXY27_07610 [Hydrogenophilaceae bacterium]|nr:hypothetical protein [Hydrogenophilaceae bacterium]